MLRGSTVLVLILCCFVALSLPVFVLFNGICVDVLRYLICVDFVLFRVMVNGVGVHFQQYLC